MTKTLDIHQRALIWRKEKMQLSRRRLAELSGYSTSFIADAETGIDRGGPAPLKAESMRKYTLACAAIDAGLKDWDFT